MRRLVTSLLAFALVGAALWYVGGGGSSAEDMAAAGGGPGGGRGFGPGGGGGATLVVLSEVEVMPYTTEFEAVGTARAIRSVTVMAEVDGEISEITFAANDEVAAGDVLLTLDEDLARIELNRAEANYDQAVAQLARNEQLASGGSGIVATRTLEEARTAVAVAEADLEAARLDLDDRTIRAPISGRIGLTTLNEGARVSSGDALTTIDDVSSLLVSFELPERAASILRADLPVRLTTSARSGQVFEGRITGFDSRVDAATRTITTEASIANHEGMLWPGMTFSVSTTSEEDALPVIPALAIAWSREGAFVWKETPEGTVTRAPVTIVTREGDQVWVEAELQAGDRVVTQGMQKMREGVEVREAGGARGDDRLAEAATLGEAAE
ncbi:efflux RND transporter periplasmic adaptor subunit [Paracoccaceae bacterium GXU_MW_L88]